MRTEFNKELIWNYISLVFMAISGLIMNIIIAFFYGSNVLGVFSETYAWYMILSQLSVWGIHMAIVKFVPEKDGEIEKNSLLKTGLFLTILTSLTITGISEIVLLFLGDTAWGKSMQIAFTGMILLSVNKVLLNYLNAISQMIPYAFFSSLRYVCLGVIILLVSLFGLRYEYLAIVFPLTEIIVFAAMLVFFLFRVPMPGKFESHSMGKIFFFGTKILPSYMVLEMNTKVDVVCLGMLVSDVSLIGKYSFAIFFTEGFYMLYITVRKLINPGIAKTHAVGSLANYIDETSSFLKKYLTIGGTAAFAGISIGFMVICGILGKNEFQSGVIYILIIGAAILFNGKYIVFGDLLAQTGFPLEESILNIMTIAGNFVLNILLISIFGVSGAAGATAVSYFIFSIYMKWRVKRRVGFRI